MTRIISLFIAIFAITLSSAFSQQSDTIYVYYGRNWQSCPKDSAVYYDKIYKEGKLWHRQDYYVKNGQLEMNGYTLNPEGTKYQDTVKYYDVNGNMNRFSYFESGELKFSWYYYENGKKLAYLLFQKNGGTKEIKGWDENGNDILNFVYQKAAAYPGGPEHWRTYLERNLKVDLPKNNGAPTGRYIVVVSFIVNKDGKVEDVTATNNPGYGTAEEAVRVIERSGSWEPAMQLGQKVIYRQRQSITFDINRY